MKIIRRFMKWTIVNVIISSAFLYIIYNYNSDSKKNAANLDQDGIHVACKSQLEGKINGRPCSLCRAKWKNKNQPKNLQDGIIEYAERKYGKKVSNFTNTETMEVYQMLFD
jgi:hypothetical protein